jgi:Ca2+-binding EF-hand superfamily protein
MPFAGTDEVNFNQFVQILSVFRSMHDVDAQFGGDEAEAEKQIARLRTEKMKFVFKIYDIKKDGFIDKEELLTVLKMMVSTYVSQTDLDAIVEQTFREADFDKDDQLSFEEFRHVIEHTDIGQRLSIGF